MPVPVIAVENISKHFPGVQALADVSMEVDKGEVMALVGENGAGKSTLMKIIDGIHHPDNGRICIEGEEVSIHSPHDSKHNGIAMIHQELSLVGDLSVAENIYLGALPIGRFGRVNWPALHDSTQKLLDRLGCTFSPKTLVKNLAIAHKQLVEIARALVYETKVVIFDEPTTSLTDKERVVLFDIIRELQQNQVGIIYISHKLDEVFEIANRISVLRDGVFRGVYETAKVTEESIVEKMIGRKVVKSIRQDFHAGNEIRLAVKALSSFKAFTDISFNLRAGEILGLYGLIGSGRTELLETIFGLRDKSSGSIVLEGKEVDISKPELAIANGIGLIPEDRKLHGLALSLNCELNISMALLSRLGIFADQKEEANTYAKYQQELLIKSPGGKCLVENLSGGNQQKVVIGKWLSVTPRILLVDEPTRGIDVGSKQQIHKLLRKLAAAGYAIMVVSSEMPEILSISDRILTLYKGRVISEIIGEDITEERLVSAITGDASVKPPPTHAMQS